MTEKKETPQEIDLIELFTNISNWIGDKIRWIYGIGLRIFYFFVRNSPWFALSIITGIAVGFLTFKAAQPFYKTELVGYSYTISNIEIIQTINNWNYNDDFTQEELLLIKKIGATYVLDINDDGRWDLVEDLETINKLDTAIMNKRLYGNFCIQTEVYDTAIISKIRTKVLDFLTNNKRVIERNYIRLKQQAELIPKIQKEMIELDSLKKMEYFGKDKSKTIKFGEVLLLGEKETRLYHNDVLALYKQQQELEKALLLYKDPFEIILDFSKPTSEVNTRMDSIKFNLKLFLAIGFLVILFFDKRKFIFDQIRRSKEDKD